MYIGGTIMKIYIIRHGETNWNIESRWQGQKDIPLNKTGEIQAKLLGKRLKNVDINKIYSSPLSRAYKTAEIIASNVGIEIITREGLAELNFGKWEGLTTYSIKKDYKELFEKWDKDPDADLKNEVGIESRAALRNRAILEFEQLCQLESQDFAIITHGAWIRTFICNTLGISSDRRLAFNISNTSISTLKYSKKTGLKVINLNDTSHLEG